MRKPFYLKARKEWFVKVNKPDGGVTQVRLGKTKKAAYEAWRRLTAADGSPVEDSLTVIKVVGLFVEHIKAQNRLGQLADKTIETRLLRLLPFCKWLAENRPGLRVADMKPHYVTDFLKTRKKWGATTRYDCLADLKQAMKWARDEGRIDKNPLESMKLKKGAPRDHVVSRQEYETLLFGAGGSKYAGRHCRSFRPVLIALWLSGCRPNEIRRVRAEDFDGKRWTIKHHKTAEKTKRPRQVFCDPCLATLSRIAAHRRKSGPLFQPQKGERWEYRDMLQRFKRLKKKEKSVDRKCVMYSFRHTWITNAMLAGLDVATVAAVTGTSIRMIDQHYGHLSQHESHLEAAVIKVRVASCEKYPQRVG